MENKIKELNNIFNYGTIYIDYCELGLGVFAKTDIKKGEVIYRFTGGVIDYYEAKNIPGKEECMALQIGDNKYIDTDIPGCYINHSCEPNCAIVDDFNLIALVNIPINTELRYDYSTTMDDGYRMECRCGKDLCRGVVEDFKKIPLSTQIKYLEKNLTMKYIHKKYGHKVHQLTTHCTECKPQDVFSDLQ